MLSKNHVTVLCNKLVVSDMLSRDPSTRPKQRKPHSLGGLQCLEQRCVCAEQPPVPSWCMDLQSNSTQLSQNGDPRD